MKRRDFVKTVAAAGAVSALSCSRSNKGALRPDILLIMPDQMRGDSLSILGHPVVKTPQLDELARKGVFFRRAYSPVASCIPARYALLTGFHPHTSGVVGFRAKPFSTPSLPGLLAGSGYDTVLVGRNMHQVPESGDCGYQKRILGSTYVADDDYDRFLRDRVPGSGGIRKLVKDTGVTFNHWQASPWPLDDSLHPTAWAVDQSRKVIAETEAATPLFLTTSFYAPHPPLFPPKKYFDSYLEKELPDPARGDWVDWEALSPEGDGNGHRIRLEGETLRKAQAGYFGLIEHLDSCIASLVSDFKERSEGAGRPWLVVVTSDHGEMLGDHGYFRKCEPYEGSANIPFIICGSPSLGFKTGLRNNRPVCLEDIMPTLLELAGISCPVRLDGISLAPALRGTGHRIRPWLHFEHADCYSREQAYHALTDGRFKYVWHPLDGSEQLFDLDRDPFEERDLSKNSANSNKLQEWRQRLVTHLADRPEGFSKDGKLVAGCAYPALNECEIPADRWTGGSN